MKEVTRIINLQVTTISNEVDDELENLLSEEECEQKLIKCLKNRFGLDDVIALSTKTFIRDVQEE